MGNLPDANWEWRRKGAYGVYNCLKKHKIAVPEEISLVGYDDIFFSEILDVPSTTVSQPVYDMGVEAVQQLISEIGSGVNSLVYYISAKTCRKGEHSRALRALRALRIKYP